MLKEDVLDHFKLAANVARALRVAECEVNPAAVISNVARVLGISPTAVCKWGRIVPWHSAAELERITKRTLRIDPSLYVRGRPIQTVAAVNQ